MDMSNILIVEDNPNNMRLITQILLEELNNITIVKAESGMQAISQADKHSYDVVLMDISLPDIDGITVKNELLKLSNFSNSNFVAVTAHATNSDQEKIMGEFSYYVSKPIDEDVLLLLMNQLLS